MGDLSTGPIRPEGKKTAEIEPNRLPLGRLD